MLKANEKLVGNYLLNIFKELEARGQFVSPRGLKTLEIRNYSFQLPGNVRFYNFEDRKLNLDYIKTEFLWYLKGDLYDLSIAKKAKLWGDIQEKGRVWSNYGYYIFRSPHGGIRWVLDELSRDPHSRRAVIPINQPFHLYEGNKDVPCTMYLNFWLEDQNLNMGVRMRSQDAWYGLGNDLPVFSWILELTAMLLNRRVDNYIQAGYLDCHVDSFHLYQQHFEAFERLLTKDLDGYTHITVPELDAMSAEHMLANTHTDGVGSKYRFNKWLLE